MKTMKAALLCVVPFLVAAADISVEDLFSHISYLDDNDGIEMPNSRINFEKGLAFQLLADAKRAAAKGDGAIGLSEDALRSEAEEAYRQSLSEDPDQPEALANLAHLLLDAHDQWDDNDTTANIFELYERALRLEHSHFQAYMNYGILLRRIDRHQDAVGIFNRGLLKHPHSTVLRFEAAFTYELLGEHNHAASIYEEILAEEPTHTRALLNLGGIYHKHFLFEDSIATYSRALSTLISYERECFLSIRPADSLHNPGQSPFLPLQDVSCDCPSIDDVELLSKIVRNQGLAYYQTGKYIEAIECFEEVIDLLRACNAEGESSEELLITSVDYFLSLKAGLFHNAWEWLNTLMLQVEENLKYGVIPSLMPFDTLSLPLSRQQKRNLAVAYSNAIENQLPTAHRPSKTINAIKNKLRIGFLSHDIGNHPTTFLFEGIVIANRDNPSTQVALYSYGQEDGSEIRQDMAARLGGSFFDIASMSHDDAAAVICEDRPDILFDLQGPTLGSRPPLLARRCSNIQVSYLAYPGSTGSGYIDYVIVDQHVAAIEPAEEEFTEKLAVLPRSYQSNYFVEPIHAPIRGSVEWKAMRAKEGLSTSPSVFVFANLNKHDKIDPASFSAWLRCLTRVPNSVLWLLAPSRDAAAEVVKRNLSKMAKEAGVSPDRIVFAKRVSRKDHIRRMAAGDLFLDTFYYGAHTTATDALRGGLPILTLAGDSFSSRVGVSLLSNMNSKRASSLITYSAQEFVDVAVEIASAQIEQASSRLPDAKSIGTKFIEPDDEQKGHGLFDWVSYSKDLNAMSRMMLEVKKMSPQSMHIVLT